MSRPEPSSTAALTRPAGRYGRPPAPGRRRLALVGAAVAALLALAWVVWAGLGAARADVRWSDVGFAVVDPSRVEVTYDVGKDPSSTAVCTLRALDRGKSVVGVADVLVGPSEQRVTRRTDTLRTSALAVTGIVRSCSLRH